MTGLLSLSKALTSGIGERKAECAILELDDQDKPTGNDYLAFQYFPETIQDTKAVNYAHKEIPGGSLPLYQWVSGGERVISFQAVFSADVDILSDPKAFQTLVTKGYVRRNVDIRTALLWLRRFQMPRYGTVQQLGVPLTQAPRKLVLRIQNSGIGLTGGEVSTAVTSNSAQAVISKAGDSGSELGLLTDSLIAIMMQCQVQYESFFPSGLPRLAVVQLSFAQTAQVAGAVSFPAATENLDFIVNNGRGSPNGDYAPYPIKVHFE